MTNQKRLEQAGLIKSGHEFTEEDRYVVESLSDEEVAALISLKGKVGEDFLRRNTGGPHPPLGIVF